MSAKTKNLIITRADSNIKTMTDITHPHIKEYAKKVDADFKIFEEKDYPVHKYHYRIMQIGKLLEQYDRVLSLDSDVLVMPTCPNIFEVVPHNMIGTIFEDKGSRQKQRRCLLLDVQERYGATPCGIKGYMNTGVAVFSKAHRDIFQTIQGNYWDGFGFDDVHLRYQIERRGHKIHELDYKWNHMTMFSEKWNNNADRFKSHIIHYAGQGKFDDGIGSRLKQIIKDERAVYGKSV